MQALTVVPEVANSVRLHEVPEPTPRSGDLFIEAHSVGICGTDREIIAGHYGEPPPAEERLILGHESLGRVLEAPADSGFSPGDWVCSIVRQPDPLPCSNCARGEWDMCQNGGYMEHGIKQRHGFATERYCVDAAFVVPVNPQLGTPGTGKCGRQSVGPHRAHRAAGTLGTTTRAGDRRRADRVVSGALRRAT